MRKKLFTLLALTSLFLVSCQNEIDTSNLIGDWVAIKAGSMVNGGYHEEETTPAYWSFALGNKYTIQYNGKAEKGTYTVENNVLTLNRTSGAYVIIARMLSIRKLTSREMTLRTIHGSENVMYEEMFFTKQ